MNTFVPFDDVEASVRFLDNARLNKQVAECAQILRTLDKMLTQDKVPWSSHPAVLMWFGYEDALWHYTLKAEAERLQRGMNPHKEIANIAAQLPWLRNVFDAPPWWGDPRVHNSHYENLLRKFQGSPHEPYWWPIQV